MYLLKKRVSGLPQEAAALSSESSRPPHRNSPLRKKEQPPLQISHKREITPPRRTVKSKIITPGRDWLPRLRDLTPPPSHTAKDYTSPLQISPVKRQKVPSKQRDSTPVSDSGSSRVTTPGRDWLPQHHPHTPPRNTDESSSTHSPPAPKQRSRHKSSSRKRQRENSPTIRENKRSKSRQMYNNNEYVKTKNKTDKGFSAIHSPDQINILNCVKTFFSNNKAHTLPLNFENNSNKLCHCMTNNLVASHTVASLKLRDSDSGWNFLVDTGACKSFVPKPKHKILNLAPYDGPPIITANGQSLKIHGVVRLHLVLQGKKYTWTFVVADVALPLLGADFLTAHRLAVDMAGQKLISTVKLENKMAGAAQQDQPPEQITKVLENFHDIFSTDLAIRNNMESSHAVKHKIITNSPPLRSKFRRLSPDKLEIAKQVFSELEKAGICQKAASPWASPLHMVKKSDGSYRPCGDYRRLNTVTEPDHYPLPNITDITNVLGGAKYFSKIDLTKGYHQVPISTEDIPKTAICTPFGTYTFNYTCFGLRNAGATFQRLMDDIFSGIPCIVVYIDDLLIFSPNLEQHAKDIAVVLQMLKENGLIIRPDKCIWAKQQVEFLGHQITHKGVLPLQNKVQAVETYPTPNTIKELMAFNGMVNYYHRFVPNLASVMGPLYDVLKGKPKQLRWTEKLQKAFQDTKKCLAQATLLSYPQSKYPLTLTTDASDIAIGGVLEQKLPNGRKPIGFFSRKLTDAERNYCTLDKELLALHRAIRHFHHLLDERIFIARTDHLPLVHAFIAKKEAWSPRVRRQLSEISEYQCTLEYIKGPDNVVADSFSRYVAPLIHLGIDYAQIHQAQKNSVELQNIQKKSNALHWQKYKFGDYTIVCDISTSRPRPYLPTNLRRKIFDAIHSISHPSANSTTRLITSRYIWEAMRKDIKKWVRECQKCQTFKISTHVESGIQPYDNIPARFAKIHMDIVGPLPPSDGYKYILTIIDRASRWTEAFPLRTQSATSCLKYVLQWISRYGLPESIVTDRGTNFTSDLWHEVITKLGIKLQHVTAYNPEANGIIERFHRTLKTALASSTVEADWSKKLPWVLLAIHATPHAALGASPSEAVFGKCPRLPLDILPTPDPGYSPKEVSQITEAFMPPKQTYNANTRKIRLPPNLFTCPFVYERIDSHRSPFTPNYAGPYPVLIRESKAFLLNKNSKEVWVSIDRLKPAYLAEEISNPGGGGV